MGRIFFPTNSLNRFGVRDSGQPPTLGADPARFPAEPAPRAAANPTGPLLGAVDGLGFVRAVVGDGSYWPSAPIRYAGSDGPGPRICPAWGCAPPQAIYGSTATPWMPPANPPAQVINSSGGGGAQAAPASSPSVSSQTSPTPVANVQQPPPTGAVLISSGGGTQTPATTAAPAAAPGFVEGVAAWLGGSTRLLNYNVPNAVLAGAVVLGFAWLSSGSGKKR